MKEQYRQFCQNEKDIPIFSKDWWLDAVCGVDNWDVALVEKSGQIVGALPYFVKKRYGFFRISMPQLTQNMGVYIKYPPGQKYYKKLSWEKEIMSTLIEKLPKFDSFSQSFHYNITNWLPFYWKNYEQCTYYTYVIEDINIKLEEKIQNFSHAKKKNIKRAEQELTVCFDLSAKDFYSHHRMTLKKLGDNIQYSWDLFKNIYNCVYENNAGRTIYAIDKDENIHAALFVIWDCDSAYDLISTIDPEYRNSGSTSLLIKEVIKFVSNITKKFDFEGSMIENVENSFRQFGAIQKPYFHIYKTNSNIIKAVKFIRSLNDKN